MTGRTPSVARAARVEVRGIGVRFGGATALDDVSFEVGAGRLVGIVGPNGAGKSTLLRCMHGELRPTQGAVSIDGADVATATAAWIAQRVGVVPQGCAPRFPYVVEEFVAMGRYPHEAARGGAAPADRQAVARAMETAGVAALARRTVDRLSGGELRRVLLAQVLAQEPTILLLDEPLQQLDLRYQLETMALVRQFVETPNSAAVAVLHDLGMAARYCDTLVMLHEGRVAAAGTPASVLTRERLREIYGVEAVVRVSDVTGTIEVVAAGVAGPGRRESASLPPSGCGGSVADRASCAARVREEGASRVAHG